VPCCNGLRWAAKQSKQARCRHLGAEGDCCCTWCFHQLLPLGTLCRSCMHIQARNQGRQTTSACACTALGPLAHPCHPAQIRILHIMSHSRSVHHHPLAVCGISLHVSTCAPTPFCLYTCCTTSPVPQPLQSPPPPQHTQKTSHAPHPPAPTPFVRVGLLPLWPQRQEPGGRPQGGRSQADGGPGWHAARARAQVSPAVTRWPSHSHARLLSSLPACQPTGARAANYSMQGNTQQQGATHATLWLCTSATLGQAARHPAMLLTPAHTPPCHAAHTSPHTSLHMPLTPPTAPHPTTGPGWQRSPPPRAAARRCSGRTPPAGALPPPSTSPARTTEQQGLDQAAQAWLLPRRR
jgi:hypothetical protein